MPNDAYEHMKMLLNVSKNAKIVIECELRANVRFLALMNASSRYWSQCTQMNAYFLVMNSKRCNETYLPSFQCKILNYISYTNELLCKIGYASNPNCSFNTF